ncbi:hypothetical protein [Yoonia sp. R78084]|uniref:hypothetical protein n=1 Tax=Yoonia sp. R78084 TaxID=3093869 RepID=UPI0037DC44F5
MSKYHPIDVRYKGPSTAYRGSAHRKAEQRASVFAQTKPRAAKTVPTAIPKVRRSQKRPVAQSAKRPQRLTRLLGFVTRGNLALAVFLLVIGLISNPHLLWDWLSLGSTQMNTIP